MVNRVTTQINVDKWQKGAKRGLDHIEEYCSLRQVDTLKQNMRQPPMLQKTMLSERQQWYNKVKDWQFRYNGHPKMLGARSTEGNEALAVNPELWDKPQTVKGTPATFMWNVNIEEGEYSKLTRLQDTNMTSVSTGSNHSEISKVMEKISETNQLLAQQQMTQQRTLQAVLYCQEQTSEIQEASQRVQSQALMALTEATQQ